MKPSPVLSSTAATGDSPFVTLHWGKESHGERRNALWDTVVFLPGAWEECFRRYLLRAFARQRRGLGKVICVERPKGWRWPSSRQEEENLWILSPGVLMHPQLAERIPGMTALNHALLRCQLQPLCGHPANTEQRVVTWLFHPFQADDLKIWPHDVVLYDCYDRYDEPPQAMSTAWKRDVVQREMKLMAQTDLILTVSQPLHALKAAQGFSAHRVPNGVDGEFFGRALKPDTEIPKDLARIPGPRLGFIGQMSDRIDFVLLDRLAEQRPKDSLVLVGDVQGQLHAENAAALRRLKSRPNVYALGARPYEQLPNYLKGFDLCLVPYADTPFNRHSSPLKVYEYLASGKPVVSVSVPEMDPFWDVVSVVKDRTSFAEAVGRELDQAKGAERQQKRLLRAKENSWDHRAEVITHLIQARGVPLPTAHAVLHLVTGFDVGDGIVEMVAALTSKLQRKRFIPIVCALRGSGRYQQIFQQQGLSVSIQDLGSPHGLSQYRKAWQVIREVRSLLKQRRVRVLHAHNFFAGVIGLLASFGLPGIRRVITMHGYFYFEGWMKTPLKAWCRHQGFAFFFRAWDQVIGVSEAVRQWVARFGVAHSRNISILNGIRSERFLEPADPTLYRTRWSIPEGAKLIGTLGIIEKIKGGDCLLDAAAQVLKHHPQSYFVFIGAHAEHEPETLNQLREQIDRLGLRGRVLFTERVLDVAHAIAALDVFVFASTHAGFGLAVAEAMYLGKPVIATAIGGIPEIVEDHVSGLLIPADDPTALAQAIQRLLANPAFAEGLGRAGRERIQKHFLAERMAMDYERIYQHLTQHSTRGDV